MKRQIIINMAIALVGLAAGAGIGILYMKPQLDERQQNIDELQDAIQTARLQYEKNLKAAAEETEKLKAACTRLVNDLNKKNAEIAQARTESAQLRAAIEQIANSAPQEPPAPARQTPQTPPAAKADAPPVPKAAPGEYIIKDGDSFWKIAAAQLGSGPRYQEIINLNPQIDPKKPLTVGTKIKLPQK